MWESLQNTNPRTRTMLYGNFPSIITTYSWSTIRIFPWWHLSFITEKRIGILYHDIGYPFKVEFLDVGHDVSDEDLRGLSPMTLVALTAMKYIWNAEQFSVSFKESAVRLLKMQNTDTGREFIRQSLYYFFWKWPYKENSEVIKMDSPEAVANKGYESFAEHFISVGEDKAISVLQNMGLSDEQIAEFKAKFATLK